MASFRRYAQLQIAALLLAGAGACLVTSGPARLGALLGVGAAAISALAVISTLPSALAQSLQKALAAVVATFLIRMVLVGVSLLVCHRVGGDLLACTAGFFIPYLVCQTLEVAFVAGQARPAVSAIRESA